MGGLVSGNYGMRLDKKAVVEDFLSIDVRRWHREGALRPGQVFTWVWQRDGRDVASIGVRVRREAVELSYTVGPDGEDVRCSIALERRRCHFGGSRPWFVCPGVVNGVACGRRVAILYGPPGRYFLCRHCYGLSYRSRQESKDFQVTAGNSIVSISWVRRAL